MSAFLRKRKLFWVVIPFTQHGLQSGIARLAVIVEQALDGALDLAIGTFAGVLEHDLAALVDDVLRWPEAVVIGIPGRKIVVLRDRIGDAVPLDGSRNIGSRFLEG